MALKKIFKKKEKKYRVLNGMAKVIRKSPSMGISRWGRGHHSGKPGHSNLGTRGCHSQNAFSPTCRQEWKKLNIRTKNALLKFNNKPLFLQERHDLERNTEAFTLRTIVLKSTNKGHAVNEDAN